MAVAGSDELETLNGGNGKIGERNAAYGLRAFKALVFVLGAMVVLLVASAMVVPASKSYTSSGPRIIEEECDYDVIVIGAGPAGSVIAGSVSTALTKAGSSQKVLLLESGSGSQRVLGGTDWLFRDRTVFDVPLAWSYVSRLSHYLWKLPAGLIARAVGGCGVHNAMLYVRALPEDLESWNATEHWDWKSLSDKYLEIEDWQGETDVEQGWTTSSLNLEAVPEAHSVGGPIATSGTVYRDLLSRKFLETVTRPNLIASGVGMTKSTDFNLLGRRRGAGYYHFNIRDGQRESAAAAFLGGSIEGYAPIESLTVKSEVTALRIGLDQKTKSRVEYVDVADTTEAALQMFMKPSLKHDVIIRRLKLKRDAVVVVSCGATLTPHLLHASGIGPSEQLVAANIKPVLDAPYVGSGLQDHPAVAVVFDVIPPLTADMAGLYGRFINWTVRGQPFGSYSRAFGYPGFSAGAFFDSGFEEEEESDDSSGDRGDEKKRPPPDLQLTVFPIQIEPHLQGRTAQVRYDQAIVTVALVRPKTKFVLRPSEDDFGAPTFSLPGKSELGGLVDIDARKLAAGIRRVRRIFGSSPLADYVVQESSPGDVPDLEEWVHMSYTQNSHWCCSVNFEKAIDPATLALKGVHNLRVADSSVFPTIPNGNVHSTVVAVAGTFADRLAAERLNLPPRYRHP